MLPPSRVVKGVEPGPRLKDNGSSTLTPQGDYGFTDSVYARSWDQPLMDGV